MDEKQFRESYEKLNKDEDFLLEKIRQNQKDKTIRVPVKATWRRIGEIMRKKGNKDNE